MFSWERSLLLPFSGWCSAMITRVEQLCGLDMAPFGLELSAVFLSCDGNAIRWFDVLAYFACFLVPRYLPDQAECLLTLPAAGDAAEPQQYCSGFV